MSVPAQARYASKIIKAGALLADTKLLLAQWDEGEDLSANLARFRERNLFGKASRSRVEDILAIFRQRYLTNTEILSALIALARARNLSESLTRLLYFLALQSDPLLHDVVFEVVAPAAESGRDEVLVGEVAAWIEQQVRAERTERAWGAATIGRVAQGVMATLRDFGILSGVQTKHIAYPHLPIEAFAFIALLRFLALGSGERVLADPEWRVFFLSRGAVERLLIEAQQERLLEYYAAGPVVRLTFPTESPREYAHALAQRAY